MPPLKVLIFADPAAPHTLRWVSGLAASGVHVILAGLHNQPASEVAQLANVRFFPLTSGAELRHKSEGNFSKSSYFSALPGLRRLIRREQPQILHSFYASSYGLIGALAGFHPYIISVWGSDVLSFPKRSPLNQFLLWWCLKQADMILSAGAYLAAESKKYTRTSVSVIPFGVDSLLFSPSASKVQEPLVIGTVKGLEEYYGIDTLIKAFAELRKADPELNCRLIITGRGSQEPDLRQLADRTGFGEDITFTGFVPPSQVPSLHQSFTVAVYPSRRETFGVAILESSACGVPVVVSDIPGFSESFLHGETGLSFPAGNEKALANTLLQLLSDPGLRARLGSGGRKFVMERYQLQDTVAELIKLYNRFLTTV